MRIIILFVDGVGIGSEAHREANPFLRFARTFLSHAPSGETPAFIHNNGGIRLTLDAGLGIPGPGQSATGQTTLWTGKNGAALLGRHSTGFPGGKLAILIHEDSILKRFGAAGWNTGVLNAYSLPYLQILLRRPWMTGASTHLQLASGEMPLTFRDLAAGRALFSDITHELMHRMYHGSSRVFPVLDPKIAGRRMVELIEPDGVGFLDYFLTDMIGHEGLWKSARWSIGVLESFMEGILETMDIEKDLFLLVSDHGNMEAMDDPGHTENPVPAILFGKPAMGPGVLEGIHSIQDIPTLLYRASGLKADQGFSGVF